MMERSRVCASSCRPVHSSTGTFVDAFAGCGGLSLGLMRGGWRGLFAIEHDQFAFATLTANFLTEQARFRYDWPEWLEQRAWSIEGFLDQHRDDVCHLDGGVDLLAGGPPCQGFSAAGRRFAADPRNRLVETYLDLVDAVSPKIVLMENVMGITYDFKSRGANTGEPISNFADKIVSRLSAEFEVHCSPLVASRYGVPQARTRFFLIGLSKSFFGGLDSNPFGAVERLRKVFLAERGIRSPVGSRAALSDLELSRNGTEPCPEAEGYDAISYRKPRTKYQRAMRDRYDAAPPDTKLAKHRPETTRKFEKIIRYCRGEGRLGVTLPREMRAKWSIKKMATRVQYDKGGRPRRAATATSSEPPRGA